MGISPADPNIRRAVSRGLIPAEVVRDANRARQAEFASVGQRAAEAVAAWCQQAGFPAPVTEFRFHLQRRWRWDVCWPDAKVAVEFQGGVWGRGRHNRAHGFAADRAKSNEAQLLGWLVFEVTYSQLRSGCLFDLLRRAFVVEGRSVTMNGPARGVITTPADHFTPAYKEASVPAQSTLPSLPVQQGIRFCHVANFPGYCVGDDGSVWTCIFPRQGYRNDWRQLRGGPDSFGYLTVALMDRTTRKAKTLRIHRLVLEAFTGPRPAGADCCHNDGNKVNNTASNLRWGTRSENVEDARKHGTLPVGESHSSHILTEDLVRQIRAAYKRNVFGFKRVAKQFGVSVACVTSIILRRNWKHVT